MPRLRRALAAALIAFSFSALATLAQPAPTGLAPVPYPRLEGLEPAVARQLAEAEALLRSAAGDAATPAVARAEVFGEIGRIYHAYLLTEPAAVCYANAEALAPGDPRWPHLAGALHQAESRPREAAQAFARSLALAPGNLAARVHLGEIYLAEGQLDEARAWLRMALELDPRSPAAWAAIGQIALSRNQWGEAASAFEAALAGAPEANALHYSLALAYRGAGDLERARAHLDQRGSIGVKVPDPQVEELTGLKAGERVHLLRGRKAFMAGDYKAAAEEFRQALAAEAASVAAHVNLGSSLEKLGDTEGAVAEYQRALELAPATASAHFNLGLLLLARGEVEKAAEHFEAVVAADPRDAEAHLELAELELRGGEPLDALPHYRQAAELRPDDERAWLGGAEALARLGRFGEAKSVLEAALQALPSSGRLAMAMARFLAACPDLALRDGARAVELAELVYAAWATAESAELVAMALAEADRCTEAADWQRRALGDPAAGASAADPVTLERRRRTLLLYETQKPCRLAGSGAGSAGGPG